MLGSSSFACEPEKTCTVTVEFVVGEGDEGEEVDVGPMAPSPDRIISPRYGLWLLAIVMVSEPMTRLPDGISEIGVPEIVTAAPPGDSVVPATEKPAGFAVKAWVPTVKMSGRWKVLVPMTSPEAPRDTGVPDIVTAAPPGESVAPAMRKPVGFALSACPPTVNRFRSSASGRSMLER